MTLSKYEVIGIGASIAILAVALYALRVETTLLGAPLAESQSAQVASAAKATGSVVAEGEIGASTLRDATDTQGNLTTMVIEDVKVGTGEEVKKGDTVSVHYAGRLQSGMEFDNSQKRGAPFEFTVGEGRVIKGWEEGLVGMKVGGQRILVIPPDMAYGNQNVGPIPANSTLVFSIELLEIKQN